MIRVAVTDLEYRKAGAVFAGALQDGYECHPIAAEEAVLAAAIRAQGMRHAIIGIHRYGGRLYDVLEPGGVIARFGVGHDGVDKGQATARRLLCTNTPGVLEASVAELTLSLLLEAVRRTGQHAAHLSAGEWNPVMGTELHDKTLAIIGCGAIGGRVAHIAACGFGMKVRGFRRSTPAPGALGPFTEVVTDFADAVRGADFISLHLPANAATRQFMNRARLQAVPPGCWLINTARGALVDEAALHEALASGRLGGAALDVFEQEPYQPVDPVRDLRRLPNVIMTPHLGSSTREACHRIARRALLNLILADAGRFREMDLLNPEVLKL